MRKGKWRTRYMHGIWLLAATSFPATAQVVSQGIEEIVVTATKRAENLQDVPISLSAISGDQMAKQRVLRLEELTSFVPNLQFASSVGEGAPIFSLRGVTMNDFTLNQSGPVATYYDEVYKGNFALLGIQMYDIERLEVLRGPQGTLYGKNTTGGAINIISRSPGFDTEGYLTVGFGNYDRHEANGAVQGALSDVIAARMAFTIERADGHIENVFPGAKDASAVRQYGLRGSVLYKPSDVFDMTVRLSTSLQNPINYGNPSPVFPGGAGGDVYPLFGMEPGLRTGLKRHQINTPDTPRRHSRTYSASVTANWDIKDELAVTSITSWDKGNLLTAEDSDGLPQKVAVVDYRSRARQISQDLRLTSDFAGPFDFILGAYFNREKVFNANSLGFFKDIDVNGDGVMDAQDCIDGEFFLTCTARNEFNQVKTSYAGYSDLSYQVTDALTLRGGLRFTHDRARLSDLISQAFGVDDVLIANFVPGDAVDLHATMPPLTFSNSNFSGKIGFDYKIGPGMIYASFSRGYRGAGFNGQAIYSPDELTIAEPEKVNAYEIGFKSQFFDNRLLLNGAVFWYDYRNQQALDIDQSILIVTLVNLPKSRILGGELELQARPIEDLRLSMALGVLDTEIRRATLQGVDLAGNKLSNAPELTLSGAIDWTVFDGEPGAVSLHLDGNYSAKQYFDVFNYATTSQGARAILNARVDFATADDAWMLALWMKNVTDKRYVTSSLESSQLGFAYTHLSAPRTYGVTVQHRF